MIDFLEQPTRKTIYNVIAQDEGIHLRAVCKAIKREMGVTQYHLYVLEKEDYIKSYKDGRYRRYFINHKIHDQKKLHVVFALRREKCKKIIKILLKNPVSKYDLAKYLNCCVQNIYWYINYFKKLDLIELDQDTIILKADMKELILQYLQVDSN